MDREELETLKAKLHEARGSVLTAVSVVDNMNTQLMKSQKRLSDALLNIKRLRKEKAELQRELSEEVGRRE